MIDAERLAAYADLIVSEVGANVQPDQVVGLTAEAGMETAWRAVAEAAYRRGARYVDLWCFDPYVKHARLRHASADSLSYRPPWWGERYEAIGALRGANLRLSGPVAPTLMDDIDPARLGIDMMPRIPEVLGITDRGEWNWIVAPGPSPGWAAALFPDASADEALGELWRATERVLRLDAADPAAAWRRRLDTLAATAARLNGLAIDALVYRGPGTELVVGLLPGSIWCAAGEFRTAAGIPFCANLPTEEVYTAPDPVRVDGVVTATRPLVVGGGVVEGLVVRFEGGRAVSVSASRGAGLVEAMLERDDGARRLGEVALVDRESRVGQLGHVFYDTLLDENAASHLAFGNAYASTCAPSDHGRLNVSRIHIDFMIGSSAVEVSGRLRDGTELPLLRDGAWQL